MHLSDRSKYFPRLKRSFTALSWTRSEPAYKRLPLLQMSLARTRDAWPLDGASVSVGEASPPWTFSLAPKRNFPETSLAVNDKNAPRKSAMARTPSPASERRVLPRIGPLPDALVTLLCILTTLTASAAPDQPAKTVTEIQAILHAQQDACNRGDIDGFMNGYARTASTVFISEDTVRRGWKNVRDRYRKKYSSRAKMGTLTFSDLEITPLSSDSAVALGRWRLQRANDQPHGRFTLILKRLPEGWRIVHDHTSAAPPPK